MNERMNGSTDLSDVNMYGCDRWEFVYGSVLGKRANVELQIANCNEPEAWGWIAALYMVTFIVLGALVLLTLFIGIVATSMEEAKSDQKKDQADELKVEVQAEALPVARDPTATSDNKAQGGADGDGGSGGSGSSSRPQRLRDALVLLREIFDSLDRRGEGSLDRDDMKPLYAMLPLVTANGRLQAMIKEYRRKLLHSPLRIADAREQNEDQHLAVRHSMGI